MRCTQFIGLTDEAQSFLIENCLEVADSVCPHCGSTITTKNKSEVYSSAKHFGMFEDGPDLLKYYLKDGKTLFEVVQAAPWSSGPCIFLCLEDEKGNRLFEWSDEDINSC
jgi:DNA-directed RNA polymerase subunit RPC12/RpoP